jgi:antitoxin component of MazEF toxin-antitoxin module
MVLETNTTKVGGSLYVLIPDFIVENFKLNKSGGDTLYFNIVDDTVTITIKKRE